MRRLMPIALGLACIIVVILSLQNRALTRQQHDLIRRMSSPQPGLYVPNASVRTLSGEQVIIGDPGSGGQQVLFIYNTTCQYCRASLPAWKSIAERARTTSPGIKVYGVSLDSLDVTREYSKTHKLSFPTVLFPPGKLPALYRTGNVPIVMIIDADGRVVYSRVGVLSEKTAVDSIVAAMTPPSQQRASTDTASGRGPSLPRTATGAT